MSCGELEDLRGSKAPVDGSEGLPVQSLRWARKLEWGGGRVGDLFGAHRPRQCLSGGVFSRTVYVRGARPSPAWCAEVGRDTPSEVATVAFEWVSDAQVACGASQPHGVSSVLGWPCRVNDEARSQMLRCSIRDNRD